MLVNVTGMQRARGSSMSSSPYNSVLRSSLTRRLWLIISLAMLIPVGVVFITPWLADEQRRADHQNQELTSLSRERAATLLFNGEVVPLDFARGFAGRYLVVLDGSGSAHYSNTAVPDELLQLFHRRADGSAAVSGDTTLLAWFASGREWRGAMTFLPP